MNKKAFTLLEIIITISIISLVSVSFIVGINFINKKKLDKQIEKISKTFDNALNVYLSEHSEIYENLSDNVEGAVITLDLLKNEGLIKDKIIDPKTNSAYDYKNNYYVLSDAVLLKTQDEIEKNGENECNGRVEISVFRSWTDISNEASNSVIYICPKSSSSENDSKNKELEDRVSKLETMLQKVNMGGNNYVIFNVNSDPTKLAYFNENENIKDLWRIVSNNDKSTFTLMYNQNIKTNYNSMFPKVSEFEILSDKEYDFGTSYSDCKNKTNLKKAKEVYAYSLGEYLSYDSDRSLGSIQHIYKINNDYYISSSGYNSCLYGTKINVEEYVSNGLSYKVLKNSDYISYYFDSSKDNNNLGLNIYSETEELDYISLFDLNNKNPFKSDLYNSLNNNLKQYLVSSNNSYLYSITDKNKYIHEINNKNGFNATYFRNLTKNEAENNKEWLVSYRIPLGIYVSPGYVVNEISYINKVAKKKSYIPINYVFSVYGEISLNSNSIVSYIPSSNSRVISGNSRNLYVSGRAAFSVMTAKYNPVIDLKEATLLTDFNIYSNQYKTKHNNCDSSKLGTFDCPYLLKFSNGYYSDGTNS